MKLHNDALSWGLPARALHWSMAVLMIGVLALGFYMVQVIGNSDLAARFQLTQTHKSFGFVVFALALVRIGWRLASPRVPAEPAHAKPWEKTAAHAAHLALYALMLWLPLTGWLMASASPLNDPGAYPVQVRNMVFGLFELPDPINPGDRGLEATFKALHYWGAVALALILAAHAGAALKHHFIDRDDVLRRMGWGR
jgi:cytochrome b561